MKSIDFENTEYMKSMRKKYPIDCLEKHINSIERMGYVVSASERQFQIWDGNRLIIDSDFFDDYYLNAISGIDSFYE